ncbi:MAG: glutathione S-transferase family protein [Paracoccus sp. (in: a-proteobacteria)]
MTQEPITIYTYDWLPEFPRGFMRDLRARWTAEEVARPYRVATFPVRPKSPAHLDMQPFGQAPVIVDGDLTLFESGAIALHLTKGTPLLPEAKRNEITQWILAALNSVEPRLQAWLNAQLAKTIPDFFGPPPSEELEAFLHAGMNSRLAALEELMAERIWILGEFSAADILLVDVLRPAAGMEALADYPALTAYVERAEARPAFQKALADHMAHWKAADAAMAARGN